MKSAVFSLILRSGEEITWLINDWNSGLTDFEFTLCSLALRCYITYVVQLICGIVSNVRVLSVCSDQRFSVTARLFNRLVNLICQVSSIWKKNKNKNQTAFNR